MRRSQEYLLADLKKLFVEWGRYYSLPLHWKRRQWLLFSGFILLLVVAAYFDETVRYLFFAIHAPADDEVCRVVHIFGTGFITLYLFLGFYVVGLISNSQKARVEGLMIVQSYLYSGLITISLKSVVGRWRPNAWHGHLMFSPFITTPNAHLSFPSGDVAVVFSLSIIMAGYSKNVLWKSVWIVIAVLTSLSRIYYDAHWLSDVVFSAVNAVAAGTWLLKSSKMTESG